MEIRAGTLVECVGKSMILKAYKYRIYPTKEQEIQLSKTFGCCRFVFNQMLAKRIELYKTEKKSMSKMDCNNYVNQVLKKEFIWLKEIDKFALTNSIYNMDNAYQKFFKEHTGFPKFKSKRNHRYSYTTNFTNNNQEGWVEKGEPRGSHHFLIHPEKPELGKVTVPHPRGSIPLKTLKSIQKHTVVNF